MKCNAPTYVCRVEPGGRRLACIPYVGISRYPNRTETLGAQFSVFGVYRSSSVCRFVYLGCICAVNSGLHPDPLAPPGVSIQERVPRAPLAD